jgi:hypothetical protein
MTGLAAFQQAAETPAGNRLAKQLGEKIMANKFKMNMLQDAINEGHTSGFSPGELDGLLNYHYYLVEQNKLNAADMVGTGVVGEHFDPYVDMPEPRMSFDSVSRRLQRTEIQYLDKNGDKIVGGDAPASLDSMMQKQIEASDGYLEHYAERFFKGPDGKEYDADTPEGRKIYEQMHPKQETLSLNDGMEQNADFPPHELRNEPDWNATRGEKLAVDVNGNPLPPMPPLKAPEFPDPQFDRNKESVVGTTLNPLTPMNRGPLAITRVLDEAVAAGEMPRGEAVLVKKLISDWTDAVPETTVDLAFTVRDPQAQPNLAREYHRGHLERQSGEYYYRLNLIELMTGHGDMGGTAAHEFGHRLTGLIPDRMVPMVKKQYEVEKAQFIKDNPQITPEMWKLYEIDGVISDKRIPGSVAAWKGKSNLAYRFRNVDEFWAEQVRHIFEGLYRSPYTVDPHTMETLSIRDAAVGQARDLATLLKSIWDTAGQPAAQRVYSKMMRGQIRTGTEGFVIDALSLFYPNEVDVLDDKRKYHDQYQFFEDVAPGRDYITQKADPTDGPFNFSDFEMRSRQTYKEQVGEKLFARHENPNTPKPPMEPEKRDDIFARLMAMDAGLFTGDHIGKYVGGSINVQRHWGMPQDEFLGVLDTIYGATKEEVDAARGIGKTQYQVVKEAIKGAKTEGKRPTLLSARNLLARVQNLDVDITRHRMGLAFTAERLFALKLKLLGDDATQLDIDNYKNHLEFTAEYEKNMAGVASSMGRALASYRISVLANDIDKVTTIEDLFKVVSKKKGSPWLHAYAEVFKGWMFMRVSSQLSNIVGNITKSIGDSIEDTFAVGSGKVLSSQDRMSLIEAGAGIVGKLHAIPAALSYNWDLVRKSISEFHDNPTIDGLVKAEGIVNSNSVEPYQDRWGGTDRAMSSKTIYGDMDPNADTMEKIMRKSIDILGVSSRVSLNALGLADNFFREVGYLPAIEQIAVREGLKSGLRGAELQTYRNEMVMAHKLLYEQNLRPISDLDKEMVDRFVGDGKYHEEALANAADAVYNRNWSGRTGMMAELSMSINNILSTSSAGPLLQIGLFPVFKTPMELLRWSVQHTPGLHLFSKTMRDDINAGGRRRDKAYGKLAYGTMLYVLASAIYFNGQSSGTPDDDQRAVNKTARIQPNSFKIAGHTYDYSAMQPLAAMFSLAANSWYALQNSFGASEDGVSLFDKVIPFDTISNNNLQQGDAFASVSSNPEDWKKIEKVWGTGGKQWTFDEFRNYMYLSFLAMYADAPMNKGFKDMIDAMRGVTGVERMLKNKVPTLLPFNGLVSEIQAAKDPLKREVLTTWDAIRKAYSPQSLRPELDPIFGQPIPIHARVGGMIKTTKINTSPAAQEIIRLQVPIPDMNRKTLMGIGLTEEQGYKLLENVDRFGLKEYMDAVVQSDFYKTLRPAVGSTQVGTRGWYLKNIVQMYRKLAQTYLSIDNNNQVLMDSIRKKVLNVPPSAINNGETLGWGRYINTLGAPDEQRSNPQAAEGR